MSKWSVVDSSLQEHDNDADGNTRNMYVEAYDPFVAAHHLISRTSGMIHHCIHHRAALSAARTARKETTLLGLRVRSVIMCVMWTVYYNGWWRMKIDPCVGHSTYFWIRNMRMLYKLELGQFWTVGTHLRYHQIEKQRLVRQCTNFNHRWTMLIGSKEFWTSMASACLDCIAFFWKGTWNL